MHRFEIESTNIRDMEPADSDSVAGFMAELNLFEARISADRDTSEQAGRDHFEYLRGEIRSLGGSVLLRSSKGDSWGACLQRRRACLASL